MKHSVHATASGRGASIALLSARLLSARAARRTPSAAAMSAAFYEHSTISEFLKYMLLCWSPTTLLHGFRVALHGEAAAKHQALLECAVLRAVHLLLERGGDVSVYRTSASVFVVRCRRASGGARRANVYCKFRVVSHGGWPRILEYHEAPTGESMVDYRPHCAAQLLFVDRAGMHRAALAAAAGRPQSARVLALCMAAHARLGAGSWLHVLLPELLEAVLQAVENAVPALGPCSTIVERAAAWAALRELVQ